METFRLNTTERVKKRENAYYKCGLDVNLATNSALVFSKSSKLNRVKEQHKKIC
jgi:hypothetical protein